MRLATVLMLAAMLAIVILYILFFIAGINPAFPHWPDGSKC